ncbi:MAG: hypothetical protein HC905_05630 [Bacteroidales bacterium]|nr:hypothetical protein [Bacteroidales bacterium]
MAPAWGEDTDIDYRFGLIGIKNQSLKHIAIQYHTYHKTLDRVSGNAEIYQKTVDEKIWYTPFGINQIK